MYEVRPIGFARSDFKDKFGTPRQSLLIHEARSFLKLEPWVQPEDALRGLGAFSHIWVVFLFHKVPADQVYRSVVHPPRLGGEAVGVFASRSPHRPNRVGLSLVKLLSVAADGAWVSGVDFIEGTPILDLKPYLVETEARPEATGGWTTTLDESRPLVEFLGKLEAALDERLRSVVIKAIELDPRPPVYKARDDHGIHVDYALRVGDLDVHFNYLNSGRVLVTDVKVLKD